MKVTPYLKATGLSVAALAEQVGVSRQTMYRYVAGARIPSRDVMIRIVEVTGGQVRPEDFYDIPKTQTERAA